MKRCLVKRKNDNNSFKINDAFLHASFGHFKRRLMKPGIRIEREKFYPGLGAEPGPLAFRANAPTNSVGPGPG